jgi:predicted Zn-dependent peptidase
MIINLTSETKLSGFYIVYKGSTNLEKPGWRGLSHLMEHLVCKSVDHLQEDFDRDGLIFNAYTSRNEIVFYLTGLDSRVNKWKETLINLLLNFQITNEEFENERKCFIHGLF